jgi:hypothetical protein
MTKPSSAACLALTSRARDVEFERDAAVRAIAGDRLLRHGLRALDVAGDHRCNAARFAVAASVLMRRPARGFAASGASPHNSRLEMGSPAETETFEAIGAHADQESGWEISDEGSRPARPPDPVRARERAGARRQGRRPGVSRLPRVSRVR